MSGESKEFWDVLDENGNKTGRVHERGIKTSPGDYHLIVHVWKYNKKGEWLIDKRTDRGYSGMDGMWETTGGCAVAGDDSLSAALRETKEELGLDLDPDKGFLFHRVKRRADDGHNWFEDVWVFEHDCPVESVRLQEEETCGAMWATVDKIREMIAAGEFLGYMYFDEMAEMVEKVYGKN